MEGVNNWMISYFTMLYHLLIYVAWREVWQDNCELCFGRKPGWSCRGLFQCTTQYLHERFEEKQEEPHDGRSLAVLQLCVSRNWIRRVSLCWFHLYHWFVV